ncbi:MAG TPA: RidA family protein [Rhodopila sp.]|jgi:enamine deaminase RidA (YjgF/YER057c/UK114 family)
MADPVTYPDVAGAIAPTGPWSVAARAGGFLFVAGMRGINPATDQQVEGDLARVRQAFNNMLHIAESQGSSRHHAVRLVVYVTDMNAHRPLVNQVQQELWGAGAAFPPRSIVQVTALNQNDIVEVEGTFLLP